ncbi:hypothetical protein E0L36_04750 [Streptomyces sp. AJS327]|uniref:UbiA family prenyltransferase n=1 Tax=Streptomyces sp. AJS327 TaxID=2545265 RepID=UPI0015DEF184|nr:UbiA family prenyltransferase [Streptomyces sp. AJS327]MBA0050230.1 hypothetical protein [Streptomyces sp. AJS327]
MAVPIRKRGRWTVGNSPSPASPSSPEASTSPFSPLPRPEPSRSRTAGHLETLRIYDLTVIALVTGLGAAMSAPPGGARLPVLGLAACAGALACAAALYMADYLTRHEDQLAKPHRPIPSGRISGATVARCAGVAAVAVLGTALAVNWHALVFLGAAVGLYGLYGRWGKRRGLLGDLLSGVSGPVCAFLAGACYSAPWPPGWLWFTAVLLGLQGVFSNLLLALHDLGTDRAAGCGTFPVRHGPRRTVRLLTTLALATYLLCLALPATMTEPPTSATLLLLGCAVLCALRVLGLLRPPGHAPCTRPALVWHFLERLLLPGALLAQVVPATAAVLPTLAAGAAVLLSPRPMLSHAP